MPLGLIIAYNALVLAFAVAAAGLWYLTRER